MVTKQSTFEEKVNFLRNSLQHPNEIDDNATLNILNLVGGGNISNELLETEGIIFSNLSEFSDIKTELKAELTTLKKTLAYDYLSIITSCHFIPVCRKEDIKPIPQLHKLILCNLGVFTLNKLLSKYISTIDTNTLFIVKDATELLRAINEPLFVLGGIVEKLFVE